MLLIIEKRMDRKMDFYTEQIVKKKKGAVEWLILTAAFLGAIAILYFGLVIFQGLFPLIVLGVGFGVWYVIGTQNIEYEYCVTNGDIDIDQILGQRKRKRIVSVKGKKLQAIAPFTEAALQGVKVDRFVMAAPSLKEEGNWYFTYTSKKSGFTAVVFWPNQKVLKSIYRGLPRLAQIEMERAGYRPMPGDD